MTRRVLRLSALALFLSVAPAAAHAEDAYPRNQDALDFGADIGASPWFGLSPQTLASEVTSFCTSASTTCVTDKNELANIRSGLLSSGIASRATASFNDAFHGDLTLHIGWRHQDFRWGRFILEGAYESPDLNPFGAINTKEGSGSLIQARFSWFFLRLVDPGTNFDLGVEAGGGTALLQDNHFFQFDGASFEGAVRALYEFNPYVSVEAYYRFTAMILTTFYSYDSANTKLDQWETLKGLFTGFNEFGVGILIHVGAEPHTEDSEGGY